MLAGSLLQTAYGLINAFWVGKFLGTKALAAVTVSLPSVFVLISVAGGLTLATNIVIAQYVGAHDYPPVKATVQTSVLLIGGSGFVFLLLGQLLASRLLHVIETPPDVLPTALPYLRIFLWTMPLSFGIFLIGSMLRGIGDSQTPVYFQSASVALNAALDPILMFGLLGLPKLGLNGTAWATLIAQIFAMIGLMIYVPARRPLVAPDWRRLRIDSSIAWLLARIGFPAMIQQSVVSVSLVVIVKFVSRFGTNADAAFGAAVRIDQVSFLPALIIGAAISTLAGQNIGARQYRRVQQVFRWGVAISGAISAVISALVLTFPGLFLRMFVSDARVIAIGVGYLRIVGITYLLYAVLFAANGVINGAGHTSWTTAFSVVGLWGVRLPLAYILANHLHSVRGIWWGMLISVGVSMVLSVVYYVVGGWKRPILRGLAATPPTESAGRAGED